MTNDQFHTPSKCPLFEPWISLSHRFSGRDFYLGAVRSSVRPFVRSLVQSIDEDDRSILIIREKSEADLIRWISWNDGTQQHRHGRQDRNSREKRKKGEEMGISLRQRHMGKNLLTKIRWSASKIEDVICFLFVINFLQHSRDTLYFRSCCTLAWKSLN